MIHCKNLLLLLVVMAYVAIQAEGESKLASKKKKDHRDVCAGCITDQDPKSLDLKEFNHILTLVGRDNEKVTRNQIISYQTQIVNGVNNWVTYRTHHAKVCTVYWYWGMGPPGGITVKCQKSIKT